MDFGGFIFFILVAVGLVGAAGGVLGLYLARNRWRHRSLLGLFIATGLELFFGLWLVKVYYLDEGLVRAAMDGDVGRVQHFLAWGADPEAQWEDGRTALDFAKANGNPAVVTKLKNAGAKR